MWEKIIKGQDRRMKLITRANRLKNRIYYYNYVNSIVDMCGNIHLPDGRVLAYLG